MDDTGRYFAVFGNPVAHSKSPLLYNPMFRHSGYPGYYTRIMAATAGDVAHIIREYGLSGANITTPFKEDMVPFLDELSNEATLLSAVNTILNRDGRLHGYNTDGCGVTGALREEGIDPSGRKFAVFGAGGAGKAAALALTGAGADVVITNRSYEKAERFGRIAGCNSLPLDETLDQVAMFDVLVLTLPPGVYPFGHDQLNSSMTILDANYRGDATAASEHNYPCRVIRGDRWLLHQALEAFRLFTGLMADKAVMEQGLRAGNSRSGSRHVPLGDNFRNMVLQGAADMFTGKETENEHNNRTF